MTIEKKAVRLDRIHEALAGFRIGFYGPELRPSQRHLRRSGPDMPVLPFSPGPTPARDPIERVLWRIEWRCEEALLSGEPNRNVLFAEDLKLLSPMLRDALWEAQAVGVYALMDECFRQLGGSSGFYNPVAA